MDCMRKNSSFIMVWFMAVILFCIVFILYRVSLEPIVYAAFLTMLCIVIYQAVKYFVMQRKHAQLKLMMNRLESGVDGLPEPDGVLEQDYQELLRKMSEIHRAAQSKSDRIHTDMANYYSMWAHQIKTPISAMRLLLENENTPVNEELSEQIFKIEQYVEMVLHYLKIEDMSSDLLIKEYQLDDIVRQAVRKYRKMFIRKKIGLDYSKLEGTVLTDEKWLLFILEQVISNALKYTSAGKILIYMDSCRECTLVIEDSGIGVKAEDLPRVFEKGFTGFNGRADKKSTGIGLYLCKQIARKLMHTIEMESEPGKGTKVRIGLMTDKVWID